MLLPVGGPIYQSAAAAIRDSGKDIALIGVDADVYETDPTVADLLLTSILKGIDVGVRRGRHGRRQGRLRHRRRTSARSRTRASASRRSTTSSRRSRPTCRASSTRSQARHHRRLESRSSPTSRADPAAGTGRSGDAASPLVRARATRSRCGTLLTRIGRMKLELRGITKRFGSPRRQRPHRPHRRARRDPLPPRRERRRQVDPDERALRPVPGRRGRDPARRRRAALPGPRRRDGAPASAWCTSTSC